MWHWKKIEHKRVSLNNIFWHWVRCDLILLWLCRRVTLPKANAQGGSLYISRKKHYYRYWIRMLLCPCAKAVYCGADENCDKQEQRVAMQQNALWAHKSFVKWSPEIIRGLWTQCNSISIPIPFHLMSSLMWLNCPWPLPWTLLLTNFYVLSAAV